MLDQVIAYSIRNKFVVGLATLALVLWGIFALSRLPIDALPDITNNQVQVITTSPTLAAQEVETILTYPIEQRLKSIPEVIELRSVSRFGLSLVTVVFEEDADIYWARAQINERLQEAKEDIPAQFGVPTLAPISTGLGEIYQYLVYPAAGYEDSFNTMDLRSVQDWIIKPQLLGTAGVAEVNTLGGLLKEYEVAVQPDKLASMNTNIAELLVALERNNENTGGAYIEKQMNAYFIRGVGMVNSLEDIRKIVIKNQNGIPILIRDVAEVQFGHAIRYGATTKDGKGEAVSGIVMMLKGANSAEVVGRVKDRMEQIRQTLPRGIVVEPFLDRSKLVGHAIATVRTNLLEGALIVVFILILLLGNLRAGLIVASVIPLSLLFAVSLMQAFGVSGNLMSLGAIDFGLIVDGAVIIVEAIVHQLQSSDKGKLSAAQMDHEVYDASRKIRGSAAFGELIILIVYLPILALVGIEGKMFKPMAQTVSFAILGAFLLSLTYVPMMSALFLSKQTGHKATVSDKIMASIYRFYRPILDGALRVRALVVAAAFALFVLSLYLFRTLGGEFIPTLEEGDIATHVMIPPGSSMSQEIESTTRAEKILLERFPEVIQVVSKIGSAETPTDPMPMEVADVMVILKDKSEWTSADTKEGLMEKMEAVLDELPGVTTEFSQPIQMRFNELMTGVRNDVAVKIFGDDLGLLESIADDALPLIQSVAGVEDARAETVSGLPQIKVDYNKDKLALYGLSVADLNQVVRAGFAGQTAGLVYEGERRYDLVVRMLEDSRQDIDNVRNLLVSLPSGSQIPLGQVADISYDPGPNQISREDGKRRIVIGFNVRGRDVESIVAEIQEKLAGQVTLPAGYYFTYGGQFENLIEANKRLAIAVPVALLLIFTLLYFTFRSVAQALLIFMAIPLSAIGGVVALWLRDMPFSISAGVGFIALFGVAVLNGIVLIAYFNQLKSEGVTDVLERIRLGTRVRLRPVIMTAAVASMGFLPMALSQSAGAEVQKPLATVVIGGLLSATLLTLVVLPLLYTYLEQARKPKAPLGSAALIMFLLCTLAVAGQAQNPVLTLQQAEALALQQNPRLQASSLDVRAAEAYRNAATPFPKALLTAQLGQNNSLRFDENLSLVQSFPNPKYLKARNQLAETTILNRQAHFKLNRAELLVQVRQYWLEASYANAQRNLYLQEDSLQQSFVRIAELRLKVGDGTALELTTAQSRHQQLQLSIAEQTFYSDRARQSLLALLRAEPNTMLDITPLAPIPITELPDTAQLASTPAAQVIAQQVAQAEAQLLVVRAERLPDFQAGYFVQSIAGPQQVDGEIRSYSQVPTFQGLHLGIALPLVRKGMRAQAAAANFELQSLQAEQGAVREELQLQLAQLVQELAFWSSKIAYYESSALTNARDASSKAKRAYEAGDINYVEYLFTLGAFTAAQRDLLQAIYAHNLAAISLQSLRAQ